jgi:hypothetical protein
MVQRLLVERLGVAILGEQRACTREQIEPPRCPAGLGALGQARERSPRRVRVA